MAMNNLQKKYVFKPYSKYFPSIFELEKTRISKKLHTKHQIEHIGSTAVPGLGGKGIIDIAVAVKKNDMAKVANNIKQIGYNFRPKASDNNKFFFRIDLPDKKGGYKRYHLHLTYPESNYWKQDLAFKDYLIKNPKIAQKYAKVKQSAANRSNNNEQSYKKIKTPMIQKIIKELHINKK